MNLPAGKLPVELLRALLAELPAGDPSVLVGGAVGEDAAVIDVGGPELLVAKTDPITFATEDLGGYLLAVTGNDLVTMGATPRWLLVTILLPEGVGRAVVADILATLERACRKDGVSLVGGHTEITTRVDRPIAIGCLLGTVPRERLVRTSGARAGDAILLAGGIAIEGTMILATEHAGALRAAGVEQSSIEAAAGWRTNPGISVLPAARALQAAARIHAMHDPTEGGLLTALHELAEAAEVGLRVRRDAIPVLPECAAICAALRLDPLGLLASGALLATLAADDAPVALERLRAAGIPATQVGEIVPAGAGRLLLDGAGETALPAFARDELARYLETR